MNDKNISVKDCRTMTQEELAEKINVSVKDIQQWEMGEYTENEAEIFIRTNLLKFEHESTKGLCKLGIWLSILKKSNTWKKQTIPCQQTFPTYCERMFGLKKTRVSNLLRLTQFVFFDGDEVEFISPMYAEYNTSQLIELATLEQEFHEYFTPNMTVRDMRVAKDYIKNGPFFIDRLNPNFNLAYSTELWNTKKAKVE